VTSASHSDQMVTRLPGQALQKIMQALSQMALMQATIEADRRRRVSGDDWPSASLEPLARWSPRSPSSYDAGFVS
jgi:hypothetical protein